MYELYWCPGTAALAPEIVLEEAGLAYRKTLIDIKKRENRSPAYLAVNPKGWVPALVTPEGAVLTESVAIVLYLCDHHRLDLAPAPEDEARGPFLSLLVFLGNSLQVAYKPYYYAHRYARGTDDEPRVRTAALAEVDRLWALVEDGLGAGPGPFLLGARYSAADIFLAMLLTWHPAATALLAPCPALARCFAAVTARPAAAGPMRSGGDLPLS